MDLGFFKIAVLLFLVGRAQGALISTDSFAPGGISENAEKWIADYGETEDELSWFSEACPKYENSGAFEDFTDTVFIGHINTDTDSVASSIAAAHYYNGSVALASDINAETNLVLKRFGYSTPKHFDEKRHGSDKICLVDVNQRSQIPKGISTNNIVCIIDHHALQSEMVVVPHPIHIEIKPVGSCSTLVAWKYFDTNVFMPKKIAGLLLSGIVSDTLALKSSVTTQLDIKAAARLSRIAGVMDIVLWAKTMFASKSNVTRLGVMGTAKEDYKVFNIQNYRLGFSNIETVNPGPLVERLGEFKVASRAIKKAEKLDFFFVAFIDVIEFRSQIVLLGDSEKELATIAFPGAKIKNGLLDSGKRVSRKKEFIPPFQSALIKERHHSKK
eukprot:Nk52_evm45s230 gene=Nk52_evmTU45s230